MIRPSKQQERQLAKKIGGHVTPGSGNKQMKGDAQNRKRNIGDRLWLAEAKTTSKGSISIQRVWLDRILEDTLASTREPFVEIQFERSATRPARRVYLIFEPLFEEILYGG